MIIANAATRDGVLMNTLEVKNNGSRKNLKPRSTTCWSLYSTSSSSFERLSAGMLLAMMNR